MKKRIKNNNLYFSFILILSSIFNFNKCECPNGNAFKKSGICVSECNITELFSNDGDKCIPVSKKEEDINDMINLINSYLLESANNGVNLPITINIEGEGIKYYIITKGSFNSNKAVIPNLLKLEENSINKIENYNFVLINIINTNYITTINGIRLLNDESQLLSSIFSIELINIRIDIELSEEEKTLYEQIKNEYGYDILNFDDPFNVNKCSKFTTPYKTDITVQKRKEVYSIYVKDVCSYICTYEKFDETQSKIYCNCIYDGEKRTSNDIQPEIINVQITKCMKKIFDNFPKNYMVFVMSFLCFLFLVCFFTTSINLSKDVTIYAKNFSSLKSNFSKSYMEVINKENAPIPNPHLSNLTYYN